MPSPPPPVGTRPNRYPPGEVPRWVTAFTLWIGSTVLLGCGVAWCGGWLPLPSSDTTYTTPKELPASGAGRRGTSAESRP